ncbi:MAG: sigma-70 family RNA polymerase sigma factor [Vicinamibacteria bacterium]|jgi:RNA polymerase sigma-70 factor (ECF subfamily)|nr:sigma-70 family RNA polymerase sigma factor [Vicinamibacteria bacterium]
MLRNRNQAEDVAQDVFLRLFRDFARIESESHLVHWLRRTTMHRCFDAQRQARGQRLSPIDEDEIAIATVDSDPWSSHHLRRFVAALPDAARAVIVLRYQEEMEPREIAEVLDLPVNTVKSRLQRALIVLRGRFAALEEAQHAATRA